MNKLRSQTTATIALVGSLLGLGAVINHKFSDSPDQITVHTSSIDNSPVQGISSLEELLPIYLATHPNLSSSDQMLLEATVSNQELIKEYADFVETDFSFIAAQLYTEVGAGNGFDLLRCSNARSPACGSGQVKEIAFLETIYSVLAVPGGFKQLGKSEVTTLNPDSLIVRAREGNERYVSMYNLAFKEMSPDIISQLDSVIATDSFSLATYQKNLEVSKAQYLEAENEYTRIMGAEGGGYKNELDDELIAQMRRLRKDQEKDNERLRKMLTQFWKKDILHGKKPVRNSHHKLLWYTADGNNLDGAWVETTNLIGQLNMRREYAHFLGNSICFDINTDSVQAGIAAYNHAPEYREIINSRYHVVDDFVSTQFP